MSTRSCGRLAAAGDDIATGPLVLSTEAVPPPERRAWLGDVIGRHYAAVDVDAMNGCALFNEMHIHAWGDSRLSTVRSGPISLRRPAGAAARAATDAVFVVMLLEGAYTLRQGDSETTLAAGDVTLYDLRQPHAITCPQPFSKIVIAVPGRRFRAWLPAVERYAALPVRGHCGLGAVLSAMLRETACHLARLDRPQRAALEEQVLDLLVLALNANRPGRHQLSRPRRAALDAVKRHVEACLDDPALDTRRISQATGFSPRYVNELFRSEDHSLMRYVWMCRLERARRALGSPAQRHLAIAEIAYRCGFTDPAHFSRAFKRQYGLAPRDYRAARTT